MVTKTKKAARKLLRHGSTNLQGDLAAELQRVRESHQRWLDVSGHGLSEIPGEIFALTDLEFIDLADNQLTEVPEELWDLPRLQSVNLAGNPIRTLPDRPGLMVDVGTFLRCRSQIKANETELFVGLDTSQSDGNSLVADLKRSRDLSTLYIGQWAFGIGASRPPLTPAVRTILDSLGALESIRSLHIRGLHLGAVPKDIRRLRQLKSLGLDGLGLQHLPHWIGSLELESLSVVDNKVSEIPDSFRSLQKLKDFDFSWNHLEKVPEFVFNLDSLERLALRSCNIREIPEDILRLHRLQILDCGGNKIESPPAEVAANGLASIRDYWRQRADAGVDYLCEAKLIILGEPGAGKTSLARKIQNQHCKLREREQSTEGIEVIHYQFLTNIRTRQDEEIKELQRTFQVNIWDFGGQEIYHATHQFFLTRRSVYVLVSDDRKEDTDFSYWLHIIEMLSDASPLLIVQNEKQDRARDINVSSLRARFANLRETLATNLETNRGLDRVVQAIRKELERLPHVGVGLPTTWKRVREALEQNQRDYISLSEYLSICQERGFSRREDSLQLSGYLHDLGICLHFQDDPLLKNTVVLKPSWGTDAVYRVLDDSEVIGARGQFTTSQLARIWCEAKYAGMQDELLRLMMKFQLCYALEAGRGYIAPQLLSSEQPPYAWDLTGGLIVRYEYVFLPKGIVTRFIVAMHRLIAGGTFVWKSGVVLERDGSRAEVVEEYSQRRIRVRVNGPAPHALLAIVDEQLDRLHVAFPRIQCQRFLPCPCAECQDTAEPYGFELDKLIKMARKSQAIQCHVSGEMVDATRLVREILPGALRREDYGGTASLLPATPQVISMPPIPEVFVSYAWNEESNAVVDRLQQVLGAHGIRLIRDREEVRYKDSIREFMRRLGQAKCVVLIISEKYLKSENCMFELVEVAKAQSFRERIFPIVLPDANLYKATGRIRYVRHWEDEIQELDEALKTVRGDNLSKLQGDLNIYAEIRRVFDGLADTLRDMNALTIDGHVSSGFEDLIRRIRAQSSV